MSNRIKDAFNKNIEIKALPASSLNDVATDLESAEFVRKALLDKEKFVPQVDFSNPANFAFFGSAEQYYEDTINYILEQYPYDGSQKEKVDWHVSASHLDNYIFENEYPRTTGYIELGLSEGISTTSGYGTYTSEEYISFRGGPNSASQGTIGKSIQETFNDSNKYDVAKRRENNLEIDGDQGITVEFWLKKNPRVSSAESEIQTVFDLWNNTSTGSVSYGRFRVDLVPASGVFNIELASGSSGLPFLTSFGISLGDSLPLTSTLWNHYSLSFKNSGASIQAQVFVNGQLNQNIITGSSIGLVTGSMLGRVGSLITSISGGLSTAAGQGKLSGSVDEIRFWKTRRNAEQIGKNYFTQVGGGTNTDTSNTDLGLYFKFNEGIIDSEAVNNTDRIILDYSGRVSNGYWNGYTVGARSTNSAMLESEAAVSEFEDPIIYSSNPRIVSYKTLKQESGSAHDLLNNSDIYGSLPSWITEADQKKSRFVLRKLTQTIASFFDNIYLQTQALPELDQVVYTSGTTKPYPFVNRFLEGAGLITSDVFVDATALEALANRDDFREFEQKFFDVRNKIYQNIYNNLVFIYKSKGTSKAFRNLIRCFGVGDELVRLNMYADNFDYEIENNFRATAERKKFADFNDVDRFDSTIYQNSGTATPSRTYLSSSTNAAVHGQTFQAEVIMPKKFAVDSELYFETTFLTSSIFGVHGAEDDESDFSWATGDANFQVQFVRNKKESINGIFQLSSTAGTGLPTLQSPALRNVYDNAKWNLSVRVSPTTEPFGDSVSGSAGQEYLVEFLGYNNILDATENQFYVTSTISNSDGKSFLTANKRLFAGAHRTDFDGAVVDLSDVKISSVRAWFDRLTNEELLEHAKDASSYGRLNPQENAFVQENGEEFGFNANTIPSFKTLALHWDFNNVTSSGPSSDGLPTTSDAQFEVVDISSGSANFLDRWRWLSGSVNVHHPGQGNFYLPNSTDVIQREYVQSAKLLPPEALSSDDLVSILPQDDLTFTRESRPIRYFFALEKSMNAVITDEMLKIFAGVQGFNNLIGQPVNRYRQDYKSLEKLRNRYFEGVQNTPDFEKYLEYFKWIDRSVSQFVQQLIPASANFSDEIRTIIESHVLERNKYWNKFPTLEFKQAPLEVGARGINELCYPWKEGHHPVSDDIDENGFWWKERAERNVPPNSSGDSVVDSSRTKILSVTLNTLNRAFSTPLKIAAARMPFLTASISPVSIRNLKNSDALNEISSSVKDANGDPAHIPLGNYFIDYNIIQTSGRRINNKDFVKREGYGRPLSDVTGVFGFIDFEIPERFSNKYIFVEHFSAPGGPEVNARGALDIDGEEYALYNSLNLRNLVVRTQLNDWWRTHTLQFGLNSARPTIANFHKTNRNTSRKLESSGSGFATATIHDNQFLQRSLPQSELQYNWLSASQLLGAEQPLGYTSDFTVPAGTGSSEGIKVTFVSASDQSSGGLAQDFVGLNILVKDGLDKDNNLLSASSYANPDLATVASVDEANLLLLKRNGPYQDPSWKQMRHDQHPIVRAHKEENILSIVDPERPRTLRQASGEVIRYRRRFAETFTNYIEPPVSFRFKPLEHQFEVRGSELLPPLGLQHSYGNNLGMFANVSVTNRLGAAKNDPQAYDRLKEFYLNTPPGLQAAQNPISSFIKLRYAEVVYPKEANTGLAKVRGRINYAEVDGTGSNGFDRIVTDRRSFWRNNESDRLRSVTDSTPALNSQGQVDLTGRSIFAMGKFDGISGTFTGSSAELNGIYDEKVAAIIYDTANGLGPGDAKTLVPTASQHYIFNKVSREGSNTDDRPPVWRADELSGKKPWFDSYEDYAQDIRSMAKEMSVFSEFRVSDHMKYYIDEKGGDFRARNDQLLSVDGGKVSQSAASEEGGFSTEFYQIYSHSDFMKHFDLFINDHEVNDSEISRITLKCKGVKKLLPYNGFYPMQRCLQLGALLSQSVAPNIDGTGSIAKTVQALLQPFFAPGIMYNSIKSGIAVDWATYTGSASNINFVGASSLSYSASFSFRVPFEELASFGTFIPISSSNSGNIGETDIFYLPDSVLNNDNGYANAVFPFFNWNGKKSSVYDLASNNFLAETVKFFLKEERLKNFVSRPGKDVFSKLDIGKTYYMDVELYKTNDFAMFSASNQIAGELRLGGSYFGPHFIYGSAEALANRHTDPGFAPHVPPYFYGRAIARIEFTPNGTETADTIIDNIVSRLTSSYINTEMDDFFTASPLSGPGNGSPDSPARRNAMNITASINVKGKARLKQLEFDTTSAQGDEFVVSNARDPDGTNFDAWVISTRWECPTLNFISQPTSTIVNGTELETPIGMWSGYGEIPTDNEGIFMSIKESFSPRERNQNAATTGSLIDLCGFIPSEKRIGELADKKVISEAVIAIPFVDEPVARTDPELAVTTNVLGKNFFGIETGVVEFFEKQLNKGEAALPAGSPFGNTRERQATSISEMVRKMRNYVIPPELDFLTFRDIQPFVMYMFEFEHTLNKQDLADIWQGLLPEIGRTAEKDEVIISHDMRTWEFFGGRKLPSKVRWMVFKVKRKAAASYFDVTADSQDDSRFRFDFEVGEKRPEFSFNYPYDFFSLVELGQVEAEVEISPKPVRQAARTPRINPQPARQVAAGDPIDSDDRFIVADEIDDPGGFL